MRVHSALNYWLALIAALCGTVLLIVVFDPSHRSLKKSGTQANWTQARLSLKKGWGQLQSPAQPGDTQALSPEMESITLPSGSALTLKAESEAQLETGSGDILLLSGPGQYHFDLWNIHDPGSPLYIGIVKGHIHAEKVGQRGLTYVIQDGVLLYPGQKLNAPSKVVLIEPMAAEPPQPVIKTQETTPDQKSFSLSNQIIEERIQRESSELEKCHLNRLAEVPGLFGEVVISFQINGHGKTEGVRVLSSNLPDEVLIQCVLRIFENLDFPPFSGPSISLNYPIHFE